MQKSGQSIIEKFIIAIEIVSTPLFRTKMRKNCKMRLT